LESLFLAVSLVQQVRPQQSLRAHDIEDVHGGLLDPVEYTARWNDKFSVGRTRKLRRSFPGLRVGLKSFGPVEYLLNIAGCRRRVVQRDVLGDVIEIPQCRFGPD